jgi:WD40 repeat protein
VRSVSLSADGKRLDAALESSGPFRVWDVASGRLLRTIDGPAFSTVVLSADGKRLAAVSAYARNARGASVIRLWDVDTGRESGVFHEHAGIVWSLAFSPDGRRIYSGAADHTIRIWDVVRRREVGRLNGHKHPGSTAISTPSTGGPGTRSTASACGTRRRASRSERSPGPR